MLPGGTRRGKRLHGLQVSRERARVGQGVRGGCVEPGDVLEEAGRLEAGQTGWVEAVVGPKEIKKGKYERGSRIVPCSQYAACRAQSYD